MKTPALLLLALVSISCASPAATSSGTASGLGPSDGSEETVLPGPGDDSLEGGTYSNRFFGFRIAIPEGWSVARPEETRAIQEAGKELMVGDDELRRAAARVAEKRTTPLITISRYPIGTPGQSNSVLQLVAEYVPLSGILDGASYLEVAREAVKGTAAGSAFQPQGEIGSTIIAGREFASLLFRVDLNGRVLWQSYLVRKENQHVLACIRTWQTEAGERELEEVLASLRFD